MLQKLVLVAFASALVMSCSSDDDGSVNSNDPNAILGTWRAIEFNVATAFDLDQDGNSSTNLLDELPCFESTTTFSADDTFVSTTSGITVELINQTEFTIACDGTETLSGTYTYENGVLAVTSDGETESNEITINGNRLTLETEDEDLGEVVIVYERQ